MLYRTGLGRDLALAALERGEKVIATARARSVHLLADLKEKGAETIELDVTAPLDDLKKVADKAVGIYGRVDVLVNNAGYILVGAIEESTYGFALLLVLSLLTSTILGLKKRLTSSSEHRLLLYVPILLNTYAAQMYLAR